MGWKPEGKTLSGICMLLSKDLEFASTRFAFFNIFTNSESARIIDTLFELLLYFTPD
ncbi:MAG: hypothetical protein ABSG91_04570 [Syntrophobacteraceae bacterium]